MNDTNKNIEKQARTFMPEIIAPGTGLSPVTDRSIMPTNNVHTILDVLNGKPYKLPGGGGDWSEGEDVSKSYKQEGGEYKRQERDLAILRKITDPNNTQPEEKWKVKTPGGSKTFQSFHLMQRYKHKLKEKGIPIQWVARVAQSQPDKVQVVSNSLKRTFKVESVDEFQGVVEVGAGFCIAPNYFITCAHVISSYNKNFEIDLDANDYIGKVNVSLVRHGRKVPAKIIALDGASDIAILYCEIDVEPFKLDVGSMMIGDDILTIGSPHGFENNVSFGNVGSTGRKLYSHKNAPQYFFIDAPVFQGNSGGPVVKTSNGEVVGMLTSIVAKNGEYGLNVGLPSAYIQKFCIINNISTS